MAPRKAPAVPSSIFAERDCYLTLVEMEALLREAVAGCKPPSKKGRRKTQAASAAFTSQSTGPASANDVFEIGLAQGWISSA